jgi:hypothetical protein
MMPTPAEPERQPFRAGLLPGESPDSSVTAVAHLAFRASGSRVLACDFSEFQSNVAAAYLKFSQAVIFRAMYGTRVDKAWFGGARRAFFHDNGAKFVGIYQYVTAFEDPVKQATALVNLIGTLRPGEKVYADIEEGSGNLSETKRIWSSIVGGGLGWPAGDYSGLFFARDHGLQPVDWVADYTSVEPSVPHTWWQFTSSFAVPGVAGLVDCSLFHGTYADLAKISFPGSAPPVVKPVLPPEVDMPSGTITGPMPVGTYSISFPQGSVKKIMFYAQGAVSVDVKVAHSGGKGTLFDAGTIQVSPRGEYVLLNPADVDAIVLAKVTGPLGWHTE